MAFSLLCNREISIHALREEGDGCSIDLGHIVDVFLSTPSARRATRRCCSRRHCGQYFYPRPLRGGRPGERGNFQDAGDFYPRPLRGGRRGGLAAFNLQAAISIHALCEEGDDQGCQRQPEEHENFYPRPLRGGRQSLKARRLVGGRISIHALCEEGDHPQRGTHLVWVRFLSTPSARRATFFCYSYDCACQFLSTPSARRATRVGTDVANLFRNFYPRPLRGGRLLLHLHGKQLLHISIHALCEEGDNNINKSTRPLEISIHALCEEGDKNIGLPYLFTLDFYPRPLRGGRQCPHPRCQAAADDFYPRPLRGGRLAMQMQQQECCCEFLSTPSARRATSCAGHQIAETRISIHALREEGDAMCVAFSSAKAYFYPRPPRGGRLLRVSFPKSSYNFYPRPPRGGRPCSYSRITKGVLFLSTPSARRATKVYKDIQVGNQISIHALREEGDHTGRGFLNT